MYPTCILTTACCVKPSDDDSNHDRGSNDEKQEMLPESSKASTTGIGPVCCTTACRQECGKLCRKLQTHHHSYLVCKDDLREYAYEGDGSTPGSLSSCCSGENEK